jgi:SAM-dependent methyltransferase
MSLMTYDHCFYDRYSAGSLAAAQAILPFVFQLVDHDAVVDIGCGVGTWLHASRENGASNILGVDGPYVDRSELWIEPEHFRALDLTRAFHLNNTFDLALTLECAEHLPAESASGFVASLVKLAPVILFSAAIPGQGGTHHVNEQWPAYWAKLFREHDYYFWDCLRPRFWNVESIPAWYRQNAFLVAHLNFFIEREMPVPTEDPLSFVHPQIWMMRQNGHTPNKKPGANHRLRSLANHLRRRSFNLTRNEKQCA